MIKALPHLPSVETRDAPLWVVILGVGALIATLLACAAGAIAIALWLGGAHNTVPASAQRNFGIGLEVDPPAVQARMEKAARAQLTAYGWSDRQHRHAHVPIARAKEILAAHGWPDGEDAR